MKNGVAIVSGGMDSITLLYDLSREIALVLSFEYGSKHNAREIPYARLHAERLGIPQVTVPLRFIGEHFKSALLQNGGAIPDGHYADATMQQTVVPFRNGIMLSVAAGMAESAGLQRIFLGNHAGDHAIYPDCRLEFGHAMADAIRKGTYARVGLVMPYVQLSKREIALRGQRLGVNYEQTWSCYKGGEKHCGVCGTCVERKEALAGFDPTAYME